MFCRRRLAAPRARPQWGCSEGVAGGHLVAPTGVLHFTLLFDSELSLYIEIQYFEITQTVLMLIFLKQRCSVILANL